MISLEDKRTLDTLKVPLPKKEYERLTILRQCNLLDTSAEQCYDRFTTLASRYFKMPIVLISLLDLDRQWFKSRVGLAALETHRNDAFCAYTILEDTTRVMVINDATKDCRFKANPLVIGPPFIRFYAGASLIIDDIKIGTLCLIDSNPRDNFTLDDELCLVEIAECITSIIRDRRRMILESSMSILHLQHGVLKILQTPLSILHQDANYLQSLLGDRSLQARKKDYAQDITANVKVFESKVKSCQMIMELSLRSICRLFEDFHSGKSTVKSLMYPFDVSKIASYMADLQYLLSLSDDSFSFACDISNSVYFETYFTLLFLCLASVAELFHSEHHAQPRRCHKCHCSLTLNRETNALNLVVTMQRLRDAPVLQLLQDPYLQALRIILSWVGGSVQMNAQDQLVVSMYAKEHKWLQQENDTGREQIQAMVVADTRACATPATPATPASTPKVYSQLYVNLTKHNKEAHDQQHHAVGDASQSAQDQFVGSPSVNILDRLSHLRVRQKYESSHRSHSSERVYTEDLSSLPSPRASILYTMWNTVSSSWIALPSPSFSSSRSSFSRRRSSHTNPSSVSSSSPSSAPALFSTHQGSLVSSEKIDPLGATIQYSDSSSKHQKGLLQVQSQRNNGSTPTSSSIVV